MEHVFITGTEEAAPVCLGADGSPSWSGKRLKELSLSEMDRMLSFCMKVGKHLGYEDYRLGRPVRINPFHRRYLHGMPHLYFQSYYEIGMQTGKDMHAGIARRVPLLAAA